MLGKRPCLLRATSSRSLLIPCEDGEGEQTTFCNNAQVIEKNPRPALSAPCKVVIGFDLGTEKKALSDACESPRSVLDMLALLAPQEKQHVVVARSPRSGLGSLLTATSGSGVGLEVVTQIQDNGVGMPVLDSVLGSCKTTFHSQNCVRETSSDKMSLSSKLSHYQSKETGWLGMKASSSGFMDADILSPCQRQAPYVLYVEDEHLDADISPGHSQAMFVPSSQDMNGSFTDTCIPPYQSRALSACMENGSKEGCLKTQTSPQCSHGPWQIGAPHVPRNATNNERIKAHVSTWQSGVPSYGPGIEGAVNDGCKHDHILTWQGDGWSLCEDRCTGTRISPSQRQTLHHMSSDMECEEISNQESIFSATSPPSCPHSLVASFSGFLKVCSFCGHSLQSGKDIFMYRGDQAFCSAECRYQKIVLDESKEKQGK